MYLKVWIRRFFVVFLRRKTLVQAKEGKIMNSQQYPIMIA